MDFSNQKFINIHFKNHSIVSSPYLQVLHPQIQPTVDRKGWLYYHFLYKGLTHLQILVSVGVLEPMFCRYWGMTICGYKREFFPIYRKCQKGIWIYRLFAKFSMSFWGPQHTHWKPVLQSKLPWPEVTKREWLEIHF